MNDYEIIFESERIYFIKITEKLLDEYLNMVNDYDIKKYISLSKDKNKITIEQELEWIKHKLSNNAVIFSMIEKGTNSYIGNIEIMNINNNRGEIGIAITKNMQDKHFGQESIKALLNYAFNTLNLDDVFLKVYDFNLRGIACYEKVGFKRYDYDNEQTIYMKIKRENYE